MFTFLLKRIEMFNQDKITSKLNYKYYSVDNKFCEHVPFSIDIFY